MASIKPQVKYFFPDIYFFLAFILILVLQYYFINITSLENMRISLDSIFSGMLAISGFVFTARTFITFKLNEVVYENTDYRNMVERRRRDGTYTHNLYDPLKRLDSQLAYATSMGLFCILFFIVVACFPKSENLHGNTILFSYRVLVYASYAYFLVTIVFS